jgi:hypothetical protein
VIGATAVCQSDWACGRSHPAIPDEHFGREWSEKLDVGIDQQDRSSSDAANRAQLYHL